MKNNKLILLMMWILFITASCEKNTDTVNEGCASCEGKKDIMVLKDEPAVIHKKCFEHVGRVDTFYFVLNNQYEGIFSIFPCNEIPKEYRIDELSVLISGNITNCLEVGGCIEPNVKLTPTHIFELKTIKNRKK